MNTWRIPPLMLQSSAGGWISRPPTSRCVVEIFKNTHAAVPSPSRPRMIKHKTPQCAILLGGGPPGLGFEQQRHFPWFSTPDVNQYKLMLPRDEKEEEKLTGRLILLISGAQNYNPLNSASSEEDTNSRFIRERWQRRHRWKNLAGGGGGSGKLGYQIILNSWKFGSPFEFVDEDPEWF